jgi:ribosome biogenesis GTPase
MNLEDLGLTKGLSLDIKSTDSEGTVIGRVTQEHRERYVVSDGEHEYEAEITGNLRYTASSREDFPAVGDWVAMSVYDADQAVIHKILPRTTILARQAVGKTGEKQIISTNIDYAFIVQAISNNFNINRLERYLSICYSAGIVPILVLSKTDLVTEEETEAAVRALEKRDRNVKYILLSNVTRDGLDRILEIMEKGKTYCVIGSSGVGKSTLINNLMEKEILKTGEISLSTNKGKHVTEHRELIVLDNGGIVIDTPGMKELGMTDDADGISTTFHEIDQLSANCRFPDCSHTDEDGCAVLEALNNGTIDRESYENYLKLIREQQRFSSTVAEKRRKDKSLSKLIKNYYKDMKRNDME